MKAPKWSWINLPSELVGPPQKSSLFVPWLQLHDFCPNHSQKDPKCATEAMSQPNLTFGGGPPSSEGRFFQVGWFGYFHMLGCNFVSVCPTILKFSAIKIYWIGFHMRHKTLKSDGYFLGYKLLLLGRQLWTTNMSNWKINVDVMM